MNPLLYLLFVLSVYVVLGFWFTSRWQECFHKEAELRGRVIPGTTHDLETQGLILVWPALLWALFMTKNGKRLRAQWKKDGWID